MSSPDMRAVKISSREAVGRGSRAFFAWAMVYSAALSDDPLSSLKDFRSAGRPSTARGPTSPDIQRTNASTCGSRPLSFAMARARVGRSRVVKPGAPAESAAFPALYARLFALHAAESRYGHSPLWDWAGRKAERSPAR